MIYNTGELLSHPFESLYSKVRRFYVSNRGCKIEWRRISMELTDIAEKGQINRESINTPYVYWPLAFLDKNSLVASKKIDDLDFNQLKGYNPKKHCSVCAEIYFHSDVFDMPWVRICPIHDVELLRHCPTCNMNWPTAARLRHVNCPTCGNGVSNRKVFDAKFPSKRSELRKLCEHNRLYKEVVPKVIPNTFIRGHRYFEQINLESLFLISVLKRIESLPENLVSYFNDSIPSSGVEQLHFVYEQLDYGFRPKSIPSSEIVQEVKTALTKTLDKKHKLGACLSKYDDCIACKTWYLWCISVSNTGVFKCEHDQSMWGSLFKTIFHFDCPAIVKRPRQIIVNNDSFLGSDEKKSLLNNAICRKVFDLRSIDALVYIYQWLLEDRQFTRYFEQSQQGRVQQPERCYRYSTKRQPKIPIFLCHLDSEYTLTWPIFSITQYLQNSEEFLLKWYGEEQNA